VPSNGLPDVVAPYGLVMARACSSAMGDLNTAEIVSRAALPALFVVKTLELPLRRIPLGRCFVYSKANGRRHAAQEFMTINDDFFMPAQMHDASLCRIAARQNTNLELNARIIAVPIECDYHSSRLSRDKIVANQLL
jgi:hypothetical protein